MLPTIVQRRVDHAQAIATNARSRAGECRSDQPALRETFLQHAQCIDELVALLESATWVAKLNHDTIVARETV